jgi:hypothetical protein
VAERRRVRLPKLDEQLRSRVGQVDELAVALLCLVPVGRVIGTERGVRFLDEPVVLGREEFELALDEVREPARHRPRVVRAVTVVVRTWNIFHGRTVPETGKLHVERMVRLVTEDGPGIVALQEVPVWALARLETWSGMRAVGAVAMPALGGPLARRLTELHPRRLRSSLVGQANVLLLGTDVEATGRQRIVRLNPRSVRRSLRVGLRQRLDWVRNRRVCQVLPVRAGDTAGHALNLHASKGPDLARVELKRLAGLLPAGPVIACGDLNVAETSLPGLSAPLPGIDQILVRGLDLKKDPARWPAERRRHEGALLSDHAPVEAILALGSRGP